MVSPNPRWRHAAALLMLLLVATACAAERPGEEDAAAESAEDVAGATEAPPVSDPMMAGGADAASTPTEAATAAEAADGEVPPPPANLRDGCATEDLDIDWFPEKVTFDHASGIRVSYEDNVKVVEIDRPNDAATESFTVALLQCGTTLPDGLEVDEVVEVPVEGVATYSTTFLQGFVLLDAIDALVAHGGLAFASDEQVLAAAEAGAIVEVGDQTAPDLEALAQADPDVVLVSAGFSGADPTEPFAALEDLPVIPNASYLETDPVGRAEWMKLEAMLLNAEADITDVFDDIAEDYAALAEMGRAIPEDEQPLVLTNAPFEGTWFASGGDSYTAELLADAGGDYVFADEEGSTLALDLEAVLAAGQDADIWLQAGSVAQTPEDLAATDERLTQFAAFPDRVWANDADLGPTGGNRFFEDGAVRPDLVLADVLSILHPDLLPDHELRFFGPLGSAPGGEPGASG